ncbi:MAG: 4-hydroxythreonine-4-phosphate dehydrogenase PdxA [Bacteroidetes bacterium]|nr:MAG: 4-hydroxythreonine-4-phosphate dehydrogenase PdxA [Bacteroidota bacterium]
MKKNKIRVGISLGDYNGIGPELILKTFSDSRMLEFCTPIVFASGRIFSYYSNMLKIGDLPINLINHADDAQKKKINIVSVWREETKIQPGQPTLESGKYAYLSLKHAVDNLANNKFDVLVTAPVNKKFIQSKNFDFKGHTEFLASYANEDNPLMMMVTENLKVALVTVHEPLKEVPKIISKDLIVKKIEALHHSLITDFLVKKPKIAVLGLNPHAGDGGLLGDEEDKIIRPAIQEVKEKDILAFGPYPADGLFGNARLLHEFDAVLAMYHDQGLTPFKALYFSEGVNFTANLPIVRTSPDHGPAYEITGKGIADITSFRNAVYLACDIFHNRKFYKELSANPLPKANIKE